MAATAFDPFETFVHLRTKGEADRVRWTPGFWRELTTADELLYLLSGRIDVLFEEAGGDRVVPLRGGQACVVPRGVWHRIVMHEPADLLFVTPPKGTELRRARGR